MSVICCGRDAGELRLRHLLAADEQPAVAEDRARHLQAGGHEHGRPDDGVEASDVFADEVQSAGQWRRKVSSSAAVADRGDVVEQRVEPHVDDVAVVPRHR